MSAIRLLVLGAVRQHGRAHGYQVRGDLEYWGAHEWSNAKPGSIYHALKQMAKQGLLRAHEIAPSTAGGPPRTEYEPPPTGAPRSNFALLREALVTYDQRGDVKTAAIGFMVDLPRAEAVALLKERTRRIGAWRSSVTEHYVPEDGPEQLGHIGEIIQTCGSTRPTPRPSGPRASSNASRRAPTPSPARANRSPACSPTMRRTRTPRLAPVVGSRRRRGP